MSTMRGFSSAISRVALLLGCGFIVSAGSLGQNQQNVLVEEDDTQTIDNSGLSPRTWAELLLDAYQFVAVGEFDGIPAPVAGDLSPQAPMEVILEFQVSALYQGYAPNGETQVLVPADMLVYPGEDVSRYQKRLEVRQELAVEHRQLQRRMRDLQEAYENGLLSMEEFRNKEEELSSLQESLAARGAATKSRIIGLIHRETFYDREGVIRPNQEYLVGLNRVFEDGRFLKLEEVPRVENVFWGRRRDDVATALERLAREE